MRNDRRIRSFVFRIRAGLRRDSCRAEREGMKMDIQDVQNRLAVINGMLNDLLQDMAQKETGEETGTEKALKASKAYAEIEELREIREKEKLLKDKDALIIRFRAHLRAAEGVAEGEDEMTKSMTDDAKKNA